MNFYEIKCYINEGKYNTAVIENVKHLIKNYNLFLKKSWENGYHISLYGFLDNEKFRSISEKLSKVIKSFPSPIYDDKEFKLKYYPVAKLLRKTEALHPIYQNTVCTTKIEDHYIFQNQKQLEVYSAIHNIFDEYYLDRYFKKNDIVSITKDLLTFIKTLPERILQDKPLMVSNGYISHLSHFIGFLHSLKQEERERIRNEFNIRRDKDLLKLKQNDTSKTNKTFIHNLTTIHRLISNLIEQGFIDFYSPNTLEDVKEKLEFASERHKQVHLESSNKNLIIKDNVLCTNRWILNVLYEKLVLLEIKPLDKFYMNFLLSSVRFTDTQIGGV
ncbi:hypothetical protein [Heyndrickxia acidicola]|uniref:hypothetical protein n=1 Tax=Heyndrickxia acidicola TaxID=209389 RepID=UPI000825FB84|nr:hypothetical protein [Heyndrickxia acidicola]